MRTFAWVVLVFAAATGATAQDRLQVLRQELERIHVSDQLDRSNVGMFPPGSAARDSVIRHMIVQDSLNTLRVTAIIDSAGWLSEAEVGRSANSALFLVIQHADLPVQEKYLSELRLAVEEGKARPADLAYLEDRVEMRNGRPQIYGSQVITKDGKPLFHPIRDEAHVNERRAAVGLGPLEDYAGQFGIAWSPPAPRERVVLPPGKP